jgi:crotonobetainyl-CoA:carnitine CoA-transferase CaiB-like acyl-CoA transferase
VGRTALAVGGGVVTLDGTPPRFPASVVDTAANGMYRCADGRWINTVGTELHHRRRVLEVLGCDDDRERATVAVGGWQSGALEDALAAADAPAAVVRTGAEWRAHAQGKALEGAPAISVRRVGDAPPEPAGDGDRPLRGVRVLELGTVLAAPVAGRTLAEHGADVLHLSNPSRPEPLVLYLETGLGKRDAFLDIDAPGARDALLDLVDEADVVVTNVRGPSLTRRGLDPSHLVARRPGLIVVTVTCYGGRGPWRHRPGYEVQVRAAAGLNAGEGSLEAPAPLPGTACDHTTGFLAAYGAMLALARRARDGGSWLVEASLAQTAMWIERAGVRPPPPGSAPVGPDPAHLAVMSTPLGELCHVRPVAELSETPTGWDRAPTGIGSTPPTW